MRRIFKYPVPVEDEFELQLPRGAQWLTVQALHGAPVLWALVDDAAPLEPRRFHTRGTGHPAGDLGPYVGTYQLHNQGSCFVGHLFEAPAPALPVH